MTTEQAMEKYHENYDNNLYLKATENKSVEYANKLIDAAMSYCGHPAYPRNSVKMYWNSTATDFLVNFRSSMFNPVPKFKRIEQGICPDCNDNLTDDGHCIDCHITPALDPDYQKWLAKLVL